MKRRFLPLLLVLTMLAAVACGTATPAPTTAKPTVTTAGQTTAAPTTAATTAPVKDVTLRIGWWGSQTRHDATLGVLDLYSKKTGVTFEPEFFGFDDYITKLNTLVAARDAFDLMQMGGNFPTYQDHIEYLNTYIDRKIVDTTDITPAFLGITTYEGNIIGLSNGTNVRGIAYDPAMFKSAGVALPTDKWTWADYEAAAKTLTTKLGIMGSSQLQEFEVLNSWIDQYGKKESFFKAPTRVALNYTTDVEVTEFFDFKLRLTKLGAYPNPAQMAEIKDIEGDPVVTGKAAMTMVASNQFVALSTAAKRELALAPMPRRTATGPLSHSIISSQMFCIYRDSDYKDEAAAFLSFFVNDVDANKNFLKGERGVPINAKVRAALETDLTAAQKAIYKLLDSVGKEAATEIVLNSPVQTEIQDAYKRLAEKVIFEELTPAQAAAELRTQATDILSRIKK